MDRVYKKLRNYTKATCNRGGRKSGHFTLIVCTALLALCLTSCGASIDITCNASGDVDVVCKAQLGAAFMQTVRAMESADGEQGQDEATGSADAPLLTSADAEEAAKSLAAAGLQAAAVRTPSYDSVEVSGRSVGATTGRKRNLLSDAGCLTAATSGGKKRLTLALNDATLRALYGALGENMQSYLDLSMAGVFSGEQMTRAEYLDALSMVYGQGLADAAGSATVAINISAMGSDGRGVQKSLVVPLAEILTGERPVMFSVEWD